MDNDKIQIRKPAVAGMFYPSNPMELAKTIAKFFSEAEKPVISGKPHALIVPHAGYPYSGSTAAKAFKLLEGEEYDTVIIVSPSHTVFFKGSSVFSGNAYQTPLGNVETDHELAARIASVNPSAVYFSNMGHASGTTRGEHALEVQLPFLQVVLGKFKLVAIVMGDQESDSVRTLGEALASVLKDTNSLLVASTDLSHFHPEKEARRLDQAIQSAIEKFDPQTILDVLESGKGEACGGGPVAAVMSAAKRLGGKSIQIIDYSNSGKTTGDFEEVVGYLSAVITQDRDAAAKHSKSLLGTPAAGSSKKADDELTEEDRQLLKKIARDAISARLEKRDLVLEKNERLEKKKGLFVTLTFDNELRGCIGQVRAKDPLYKAVAEMAVAAAFDDPRFPELSEEEFEKLEYEISILSSLERIHDFDDIKVGRDGLMIRMDFHSGLLLPQVAKEHGWDVIKFLEQTCLKAGLPKHSYKDKRSEIYRFSADIF